MNPILDLPLLRRLRISMASALLRGADIELVFELRQIRAASERDIVGRRLGRAASIDEARDLYDSTPIAAGYYHELSSVGLIARSATNAAIVERKAQPTKHEPEKHTAKPFSTDEQLPATLDGPDPLKGSTAAQLAKPVIDGLVDTLARPLSPEEVPGNDDLEDEPVPDLRYANGHDHNTAGPLKANAAGMYVPSCTVCGEPQG